MSDATMDPAGTRPSLFLRNATGLVKAWSTFDAFIYSFMSVNLVTLGLYGMSFAYFVPNGQLLSAVILTGVLVTFLIIVYAGLVTAMPRTGGDYAWQSRVLGGGIAFVLAVTGWWFILWYWTPIYANILVVMVLAPLAAEFGLTGVSSFFATPTGIFASCLLTLAFVSVVVTLGMEAYARIQKVSFFLGLGGLAVIALLLLFSSQADFQAAFNREATSLFGAPAGAYQATMDAAAKGGYTPISLTSFSFGPTLLLIPFVVFFLLWPNWGATLYGEVRGSKEYRRPFYSMFWGLWVTVALVVIVMLLMAKTMTWEFYNAANAAYWNPVYGVKEPAAPVPIFPYPVMFAAWLIPNHFLQALLILVMAAWFFGWAGTLFLSSTRVIFAAAFDRVLPAWAANVSATRRVPYGALILMIIPSIVVSALFAYAPGFTSYTLDAVLVIAVTYLGTIVAAAILPWRRKDIYDQSPIARYSIAGIPALTIASVITGAFLVFNLYEWVKDPTYGVNNAQSFILMGSMYVLAIAIYVAARIIRSRQGIDLRKIHEAIPVE
ncbi:MAG TPA: APC family permease [Candidatus Dormibacteraeota bacterium]|jgi:amino acid transporter